MEPQLLEMYILANGVRIELILKQRYIQYIYIFLLLIRKEISYLTETAVHMVDNMKKKTRNCEDPLDWYFCVSIQ